MASLPEILRLVVAVVVSIAIIAFIAIGLVQGIRTGTMSVRGGMKTTRKSNPFLYWLSAATGAAAIALLVWVIAIQLW